jgi:hypothetical protein
LTYGGKRLPSGHKRKGTHPRPEPRLEPHLRVANSLKIRAKSAFLRHPVEVLKWVLSIDCLRHSLKMAIPEVDIRSRLQFQIDPARGRSVTASDVNAAAVQDWSIGTMKSDCRGYALERHASRTQAHGRYHKALHDSERL